MRPLFPADSPQDVETRVLNNFSQGGRAVGDDLFRVAGFGERIGGKDTMSPQFEPTARMIAKHGWLLQQHSITLKENDFHLQAFQSIAREHPIDRLRWSIIHLQSIDERAAENTEGSWRRRQRSNVDCICRRPAGRHSAASSTRESTLASERIPQTSPRSIPGCHCST